MVFGKRGFGIGDMIEMIPMIAIVAIVAVVIFGISASAYSYDVSVRDAEARVLGVGIMKCLVSDGVLDLDVIGEEKYGELFDYCGISGAERVYVGVEVFDSEKDEIARLYEGDSGLLWVKDLLLTGNAIFGGNERVERIVKYNPGFFEFNQSVFVVEGGVRFKGRVEAEVLVNYE